MTKQTRLGFATALGLAAGLALALATPATAQARPPYPPPGYGAGWEPAPAPDMDPAAGPTGDGGPAGPAGATASAGDHRPAVPADHDGAGSRAALAPPAGAQALALAPAHGRGLYLRASFGPAVSHMRADGRVETSITGLGAALSLAAGAFVVDNLAVFAEASGATALDPTFRGAQDLPERTALTTLAGGAGAAYYVMPVNVSFSGAVLLTQARAVDRGLGHLIGRTELGPGLRLGAAKEWSIAGRWGVGLSLQGHAARMKDAAPATTAAPAMTWTSYGLSLALSAIFG
jgi:hypothetical protein